MNDREYIEALRALMSRDPEQIRAANRQLYEAARLNGELLTDEEKQREADLALAAAGM